MKQKVWSAWWLSPSGLYLMLVIWRPFEVCSILSFTTRSYFNFCPLLSISFLLFSSLLILFFLSFLILLYISMICNDIKDRRLKLYRHKSLHITSYHLLFHIFSYHIYRVILPTFHTYFRRFRGDCSIISKFNNYWRSGICKNDEYWNS